MVFAAWDKDSEKLKEVYEQALSAETDATEKLRIEGLYWRLSYELGDTNAFSKLQELAEAVNDTPDLMPVMYSHLGRAYELGNDYLKATKAYETAVETALTLDKRAVYVDALASCLFAAGKRTEAVDRLTTEISNTSDSKALTTLYEGLASRYHDMGDYELRAIALEKALEYAPNNTTVEFHTAYSYGETDLSALSLMHYRSLLGFKPDNYNALNNMGVVYGKLDMPIKRVAAYKEAAENGQTLAAANLAYEYMDAGFADEAAKVLDGVRGEEDAHQNVGSAFHALHQRRETEAESESHLLNASREQRQFILQFADAYLIPPSSTPKFAGSWRFPDNAIAEISRDDDVLRITWTRNDKERVMLARIQNRGATMTSYTRQDQYYPQSMGDKGYAFLSDNDQRLEVLVFNDGQHSFLKLERRADE